MSDRGWSAQVITASPLCVAARPAKPARVPSWAWAPAWLGPAGSHRLTAPALHGPVAATPQVHGAVGLRTLLSAQHTVQLSPESSASLVASWQPNAGVGLQVG